MKLRAIITLAVICWTPMVAGLAEPQRSAEGGALLVVVTGLRNDHGRVGCGIFNGPEGFPREKRKEFRGMWVPIKGNTARCDFKDVPAGNYAATVLHDENVDGKMDFSLIGIPTKGYGFSNNAKTTLSPPSFDAARVTYDGKGTLSVPIRIVYRTKSM
jgi:uncharacterized protein (DUF2141 family)